MLLLAKKLKEKQILYLEEIEKVDSEVDNWYVELIEVDYKEVPDKIKQRMKEVEDEYKRNWLKNFTFIPID
jgi:transcription initiation factor IIE alpha subunit